MENKHIYTGYKYYKIFAVLILIVGFSFLSNKHTYADTLSIGTAPTSLKLDLTTGQKYNGEIVVWNLSEKTIPYSIVVRGFRQLENQPGTAIMLTDEEEAKALYSAASWVTIDRTSIELVPNHNEKIYYEINVPEDATKGEYTVIVSFVSQEDGTFTGTVTNTTLSSGMPILIKIGKEFVENAELLQFTTDKNFYEEPNITFNTRIKNLGDTHITPVGEIVLTNFLNQEIARIPFNPNNQSILRENTGNYSTLWNYGQFLTTDHKLIIGPIKANIVVTYRSFQPGFAQLTSETSFWIIPWKYIIAIILVIVAFFVGKKIIKKKKQQYPTYQPYSSQPLPR